MATNNGLASKVVNGNLSSVVGNNGVYGSTGTFPTKSWEASNYFRDVVSVPGTSLTVTMTPVRAGVTVTQPLLLNASVQNDSANAGVIWSFLRGLLERSNNLFRHVCGNVAWFLYHHGNQQDGWDQERHGGCWGHRSRGRKHLAKRRLALRREFPGICPHYPERNDQLVWKIVLLHHRRMGIRAASLDVQCIDRGNAAQRRLCSH